MSHSADIHQKLRQLGAPPSTLLEKFTLGSGAGGQKINKSATCVFLKHLPSGITVKCQSHRSREQNRFLARCELAHKLQTHYAKSAAAKRHAREKAKRSQRPIPRRAKNRTLRAKKHKSQIKSLRRRPTLDD